MASHIDCQRLGIFYGFWDSVDLPKVELAGIERRYTRGTSISLCNNKIIFEGDRYSTREKSPGYVSHQVEGLEGGLRAVVERYIGFGCVAVRNL